MPDAEPTPDDFRPIDVIERDVLYLLVDPTEQAIWSVDELGREIEEAQEAHTAVLGLQRAGLVHCLNEFVFATRAAFRLIEMTGRGI